MLQTRANKRGIIKTLSRKIKRNKTKNKLKLKKRVFVFCIYISIFFFLLFCFFVLKRERSGRVQKTVNNRISQSGYFWSLSLPRNYERVKARDSLFRRRRTLAFPLLNTPTNLLTAPQHSMSMCCVFVVSPVTTVVYIYSCLIVPFYLFFFFNNFFLVGFWLILHPLLLP